MQIHGIHVTIKHKILRAPQLVLLPRTICIGYRGAIFEKRYDAHPPSLLVVWASQQKRSQKLGDFLAGKSLDSGSTSSRGCLIFNYMYAL